MTFPVSPADQDQHTEGGNTWIYEASVPVWRIVTSGAANPPTPTDLTNTPTPTDVDVESSTGNDTTIAGATPTQAGVLTAADKTKLDGVEPGATADQNAAEVPVTPAGNLTSADVQAALQELQADIDGLQPLTGNFLGQAATVAGLQALTDPDGTGAPEDGDIAYLSEDDAGQEAGFYLYTNGAWPTVPFHSCIKPEAGAVLRSNATGIVATDITGWAAAELTVTGPLTNLSFTGWDPDTTKYQRVRVSLTQDATGGHTVNYKDVEGLWLEKPPEVLDTSPGATSLEFYATTTDGGVTVDLEPIGVTYRDGGCLYVQANEFEIPAITAGSSLTVTHNYKIVTGVEIYDLSTGYRVLADYRRLSPANAGSTVEIDFTGQHSAGDLAGVIHGLALTPCEIEAEPNLWETLELTAVAATSLSVGTTWNGPADAAVWEWGDGNTDTPISGTATAHTYTTPYSGTVKLRYKPGTDITSLILSNNALGGQLLPQQLPVGLVELQMSNTGIDLSGAFSELPENMEILAIQNSASQIAGQTSDLPRQLELLAVQGTDTLLVGDVANLPSTLNWLQIQETPSYITGQISDIPAPITIFYATGTSSLQGTVTDLPIGLSRLYLDESDSIITGDIADLPASTQEFRVDNTSSVLSGNIADLPAPTRTFSVNGTASTITRSGTWAPTSLNRVLNLAVTPPAIGLSSTEVNEILADLVAAGATPAGSSPGIDLRGENSPADATSGGIDGLTAAATLTAQGWTVNVN